MMRPFRPTRINKRSVYVNKDLFETKFVFVRNDAHRPPLTPHTVVHTWCPGAKAKPFNYISLVGKIG